MSKLGIASRTQARQWILAGKVCVNGLVRKDPLFLVFPERAKIEIEGEKLNPTVSRTFILHKPRGVVTTHSDEKGRPTVFSLVPEAGLHLIAVGRLDWATSGLLILTNETQLAAWLTDPVNRVLRTYIVTVRGLLTEEKVELLRKGLEDRGEHLEAEKIVLRKSSGKESHLIVSLTEGKNREIRRIFEAVGHAVTRLKRVAYGGLEIGQLEPGKLKELTIGELEAAFPEAPLKRLFRAALP